MIFFIPIARQQTPFLRFLTRVWIVASVAVFLWLGGTLVAKERDMKRHGIQATLVLDPSSSAGDVHGLVVESDGHARAAPGWLLNDRTIPDLQAGRSVAVEFMPEDPWETARIVGEHHHGGILLLAAAVFAILGARYWRRI